MVGEKTEGGSSGDDFVSQLRHRAPMDVVEALKERDRQLEHSVAELDKTRQERDAARREWRELVDALVGIERAHTIVSQDDALFQAKKLRLDWDEMRVQRDRARLDLEALTTSHRALTIARDDNSRIITDLRELKFGVTAVVRELKQRIEIHDGDEGELRGYEVAVEHLERCARDTSG